MRTPVQPVRTVRDRLGRCLRDLRISVIETCNYRCPYCMPAGLTPDQIETHNRASRLDFTEIEQLARAFAALGVRKLRLTGGEPLLRRDLPELVGRLARIPGIDDIAMTSNGSLLPRHAAALRAAGLTRITLSLDTLDPQRFSELSGGRGRLQDVLAAIVAARAAGFPPVKINCVVQRGINDQDVFDLIAHFRGSGHVLRFIEYMDVGTCNGWRHEQVVPSAELRARIDARWPLRALNPQYAGEVASRYAFVDGAGEIGFVSSISAPFCGDCHRARLGADGKLYTCLFAVDGVPLRPLLALPFQQLQERIAEVWQQREDRYSEVRAGVAPRPGRRIQMFMVGG